MMWWTWCKSAFGLVARRPRGPHGAFASSPLLPGSWRYSFIELPLWLLCRVAHLPSLPMVAALPGSSPPYRGHLPGSSPPYRGHLPGSSPTRQNRSLALATSLFTKRHPNGCDFEGTYTSERFLTSRSVRRGQWVYRKGMRAG